MFKINKDLRRLGIISVSALMLLGVGASAMGSANVPVHAASQAELAKIFASKDPDKAMRNYISKQPTVHDVKLSPAEQRQQDQEDAAAAKQDEKAEIIQEEDGAHVNAPHAKILNAGSMALSKANGKLADRLNNALQHKDYKVIKYLTAKVNNQNQTPEKADKISANRNQVALNKGRRALHSHSAEVAKKAKKGDTTRIRKTHKQVRNNGKSAKLAKQIEQLQAQLKRISQHIRALL